MNIENMKSVSFYYIYYLIIMALPAYVKNKIFFLETFQFNGSLIQMYLLTHKTFVRFVTPQATATIW